MNAMIDIYVKYGRIHKEYELFNKIHDANIVVWIPMIKGYIIHGYNKDSFKLLDLMKYSLGIYCNSYTNEGKGNMYQ